jgi:hypothetical protein
MYEFPGPEEYLEQLYMHYIFKKKKKKKKSSALIVKATDNNALTCRRS